MAYKTIFRYLFILIWLPSLAQENYTVVKANSIVGDTIDRSEKIKFGLFPEIENDDFDYAIYLMKNDQLSLQVYKADSSFTDLPYSTERLFKDNELIWQNQLNHYQRPANNFKKAFLKITDRSSGKTTVLKKRKVIDMKLKNGRSVHAKIKKIILSPEPAIMVKNPFDLKKIFPLSEIEFIYRYALVSNIQMKITGALYVGLGIRMLVDGFIFGAPVVVGGTIPLLLMNKKIFPDNSEIKIIYK